MTLVAEAIYIILWSALFPYLALTHWGRDKMDAILQTIFWGDFPEWKCLNSDWNFIEVCYYGSNWQYSSIGLDNGLAQSRRQAIIRTNDG